MDSIDYIAISVAVNHPSVIGRRYQPRRDCFGWLRQPRNDQEKAHLAITLRWGVIASPDLSGRGNLVFLNIGISDFGIV
ncbi:MAG TPA: hypothetical protein VEG28_00230 [Dehalococcoidia bacterium]|nr:hypothetical protein [Dehalococcoidia bacterium]